MKLPVNGFDLAYSAVFLPAAATVLYKMRRHGKYQESASALIGKQLREDQDNPLFQNGCVWVHAVSVGEVVAARAMLPHLRQCFAPLPILLTTHTETGQATARNLAEGAIDAARYMPLDFSWLMRRAVATWKPRVFIPMETELWPNALDIISQSGSKIFTLNGKISENSYQNYQRIQRLIRRPLSRITAFCMQTPADALRIADLLGRNDNVHVTGNCKFDVEIPALDEAEKSALAQTLGLPWPARLLIAGSTHPGEEQIILDAYQKIRQLHPDVHLVIVPRHPERFADVWTWLQNQKLNVRRTSDRQPPATAQGATVHLVDQMGILTRLYALAEIAIVAGSFIPGIGGHNLLEPAAHGIPVVYGPYMKSQPDMHRIMRDSGAGTQTDPENLATALTELLSNPAQATEKGNLGRTAYQSNQGSAARNLAIIKQYLD